MALFALSAATGEPRFRDAALAGLPWLWGTNALRAEMLDRSAGMLYRSIRRRPPYDRGVLYLNTLSSLARGPVVNGRGPLELNRTDRPYHLGWVLEAWSGR
jgi:hypothetical protein